jgi:hypothetical protein
MRISRSRGANVLVHPKKLSGSSPMP